jgi:hypothetical protein
VATMREVRRRRERRSDNATFTVSVWSHVENALSAERAELLPGAHEHVLGQLLGKRGLAGHAVAQRVHASHVFPVELLEGFEVAGLSPADQVTLGRRALRVRPRPDAGLPDLRAARTGQSPHSVLRYRRGGFGWDAGEDVMIPPKLLAGRGLS